MRQGFVFATLLVATSLPTVGAQDAKPFARLELNGKFRWITHSTFSPDGKTLATSHCWSHGPSFVTLWDTANGNQLRKIDGPQALLSFNPLAFSSNSNLLAVGGIDEILLVDAAKGKHVHKLSPEGEIWHLAFDPTTTILASCGRGKDVLLWEVATGKKKATLSFDRPFVLTAAFSRDGKTIAALGYDDEVPPNSNWVLQTWDASTLKPIRKLAGKKNEAFHYARLSQDGSVLAVRKKDGTLDLWDAVAGKQTGSIKSRGADWTGHFGLTGDGLKVLTLSIREKEKGKYEGHLDLWESTTGKNIASKELKSEQIERDEFGRLILAPDGETVAFQIDESNIALWRGGALLKELPVRQGKN
jgi:WD40 repeat protein